MPEIDTYAPRKITAQNQDRLPSYHNPEKRITYVQITLNEAEIAEAIRNYIRAQIPLDSDAEMPVEMIAGRGDNGHSANITVDVSAPVVQSPSRPAEPMATFEEAAADARRRNGEIATDEPTTDTENLPESTDDSGQASAAEEAGSGEPESASELSEQTDIEEAIAAEEKTVLATMSTETMETLDVASTDEPAPAPKKSSLFDNLPPKKETVAPAAAAASPPAATAAEQEMDEVGEDAPQEVEAETAAEPAQPKAKSIFAS